MLRAISLSACALFASCAADGDQSAADAGGGGGGNEAGVRDFGVPDADFTGQIYAFSKIEANDAGPQTSYAVTAGFAETPSEVCIDVTPLLAPEACRAIECVPRTPDQPDGGVRPNAGSITIMGGHDQIFLGTGTGGQYQPWRLFGWELFVGGETLIADATGFDVPAFNAQVVAPAHATLTSPAIPYPEGALELARTQPLQLTWQGGQRGKLRFGVSVVAIELRNAVECEFPVEPGAATIPRELLSTLPEGTGFYELRVENASEVTAGMYKVTFIAASNVTDARKVWAHGAATIR